MARILAVRTIEAIDRVVEADQGSSFRGFLRDLMPQAEDAYRVEDSGFRSHLGGSLIGRKCDRDLWYSWHWAYSKRFPGRIMRLFNRGHLEEPRFVALLMAIGVTVYQYTEDGKQFRVSGVDGHFGGSLDGVGVNIPDLPAGVPALLEFKTHSDSSFSNLTAKGVHEAKLEHYVQMQIYMGYYGLTHTLYLAVNKNDDSLYGEIVPFALDTYNRFSQRAATIIRTRQPPERLKNASPGWYECKFCDAKPICFGKELPLKNCRTCAYAFPVAEGGWECRHEANTAQYGGGIPLSKEDQQAGCEYHAYMEGLK